MNAVLDYLEYVWKQVRNISVIDIIDILIVAMFFYYAFKFVRDRRAGKLLVGILFLVAMLLISTLLEMRAVNFLLSNLFSIGLIALVIVFQPELRSALEKFGGESLKNFKIRSDVNDIANLRTVISETCMAVESLSASKTGALIVFERGTKLGDYIRTGVVIDALPTSFLIGNIFFNKAPLHDGAAIIRGGRIHAAGCFLPFPTNNELAKELGARHRAAIGLSENSDAVTIVVSEENGVISVAIDGKLRRGFSRKTLEEYLESILIVEDKKAITDRVKGRFTRKGNGDRDEK